MVTATRSSPYHFGDDEYDEYKEQEERDAQGPAAEPEPEASLRGLPMTEGGNAARFVAQHSHQLRYVKQWGWMAYDGKRWQRDETGHVMECAKETVRTLYQDAASAPEALRRDPADWARRSDTLAKMRSMVDMAMSDPRIAARPEDFDSDVWLLNCGNGTLDLRDGELLAHHPAHLITKLAPVEYRPDAGSEDWNTFLAEVFDGDQDLIAFIQRAVGYSLTGSVREPAFFIPWGGGRNGKSTFFRAITRVLGDYAQDTPVQTFLRKQFSGGPTNDQAALAGARLITASETEANQTLDISLVKRITGGDPLTARFLGKEFFTFRPEGKVWMATNHKPSIPENTTAVWARIKLIPFTVSFLGREDPTIDDRLEAAQEAILTWAVEGCREWQRVGLLEPEVVKAATRAYQEEQDEFADFFEEKCVFGATMKVKSSHLYTAYKDWTRENGVAPVSSKEFAPLITGLPGKGIRKVKLHGIMTFQGIGLVNVNETDTLPTWGRASSSSRTVDDEEVPF